MLIERGKRHRDRRWLDSAKDRECDVCGARETVVFAHMRAGMGGGMARKPDDWLGAFLCFEHHQEQEAAPGWEWWARKVLPALMRERYRRWRDK